MSWQARIVNRAAGEELTMTVCGADLRTAERNAECRAALYWRAMPAELEVVSVHQVSARKEVTQ